MATARMDDKDHPVRLGLTLVEAAALQALLAKVDATALRGLPLGTVTEMTKALDDIYWALDVSEDQCSDDAHRARLKKTPWPQRFRIFGKLPGKLVLR